MYPAPANRLARPVEGTRLFRQDATLARLAGACKRNAARRFTSGFVGLRCARCCWGFGVSGRGRVCLLLRCLRARTASLWRCVSAPQRARWLCGRLCQSASLTALLGKRGGA